MSDSDLIDAVAHVTGEDAHEIRRRGFVLTGPEDSGSNPEPECLLDVMLVDLPESGTVDWDALGFGCREPFFTSTLKARKKKTKKQAADDAAKARTARIRRGEAAFSPYRSQPVGDPPFANAYDSPTVIGVGPWGTFVGMSVGAF